MSHEKECILSIIVPIYNGSAHIDSLIAMVEACVKGLSAELILVDDGSVDDTLEKCTAYEKCLPWVRLIHTKNHGVSHARNTGLASANGSWIQFLDVDDVIETEMADAFLSVDTDLNVCGCKRTHGSQLPVICGPKEDAVLNKEEVGRLLSALAMEDRYWLLDYCWNKWYKKSIIDAYSLRFPEHMSLGEDFVFNAQYMKYVTSVGLMKNCYYHYQVGDTGLVSRFQKAPWIGRKEQYAAHKELYKSYGLWESDKALIDLQYGQIAFGDLRMINSPKCPLSTSEKINFIRQVMDTSLYGWIQSYLNGRSSNVFRFYAKIWDRKLVSGIYGLILLEKGKAAMHAMRHAYHMKKDLKIKKDRIPVIKENKKKLTKESFSLISQNCIGGVFCHDMGREFLSPTINLYFKAKDFIELVNDLEYYMSLELDMDFTYEYPVGRLGSLEVHFYHYKTAAEAKTAWERRKKRIDYENIVVVMTDRDGFDDSVYAKWCQIQKPKVLFTANKRYGEHPDAVYYPEFEKEGCVNNDLIEKRMFYREDKLMKQIHQSNRK